MLPSSKKTSINTTAKLPTLKLKLPPLMTELLPPKPLRMILIRELMIRPLKEMTAELNVIKPHMITNKEDLTETLIDKPFLTLLDFSTQR